MDRDASTYTQHLMALRRQIGLDWKNGQPRAEYAADNLTDLLEAVALPNMARRLARTVAQETPDGSPLSQQASQWWLNNLASDTQTDADAQCRELIAAHHLCEGKPSTQTLIANSLSDFFRQDLARLGEAGFRPVTFSLLHSRANVPVPVYRLALNAFVRGLPDAYARAPEITAHACASLSAELGREELQQQAVAMLSRLRRPALAALHLMARQHAQTGRLRDGIAQAYRQSLITEAANDPSAIWEELHYLKRKDQQGDPVVLAASQLPVSEVFTALLRREPHHAAAHAASDITNLQDTAERRHALIRYQQVAHDLSPVQALSYLGALHGRLAFEEDLLRPSRVGLIVRYQQLTSDEQATQKEQLCDQARGDSELRVALCNAERKEELPKIDKPLKKLLRRIGTWLAPE
jgi:hypothetical protein